MHALNVHYNSQKRKQKKTGKPRKDETAEEIGQRKQKNRERQIRNRIKEKEQLIL